MQSTEPIETQTPVIPDKTAFERFVEQAKAQDRTRLLRYQFDIDIAVVTARESVEEVIAQSERVKRELPTLDLSKVKEIPELALATAYAVRLAGNAGPAQTDVRALFREGVRLRALMLTAADALANSGVIARREVDRIRAGSGMIDSARDLVELAALFLTHAEEVRGKTAITTDLINQAAAMGSELLDSLRPSGARKAKPSAEVLEAVELRDCFWTLLNQRYDLLRRAAMWLWGEDVDAHVPPLRTRRVVRKNGKRNEVVEQETAPLN
jgi:hypothetical protein